MRKLSYFLTLLLSLWELNAQSFYRTINSGDWENVGIWQIADDIDFTINLAAATTAPNFNSSAIFIRPNHVVTIKQNLTIDELSILEGGHLILDPNLTITFNNGPGVDLQLFGTFEERGSNAWAAGARWLMGANGTLVRTNNSSSNNWRDAYQGGIVNIPASSNWVIRKTGNDNPSLSTVGGMYYGNLIIENMTATHWDAIQVGSFFTGASDFPRIKGDFLVGGGGTGTVTFRNSASNANPVLVNGNIIINAGNTLLIDSLGANSGTGFELKGDMIVNGTFSYTGSASNLNRVLRFSGNFDQEIAGSGTINIPNLIVDKPDGRLVLERNLAVHRSISLIAGRLSLNENTLALNWPESSALSSASGLIIAESPSFSGKFLWNIANEIGNYVIPFGNNNLFPIPLSINVKSGTVGNLAVSTYQSNAENQPLPPNVNFMQKPKTLDDENVFVDRFWWVQCTGAAIVDLSLAYADADATTNTENYKAIRYNDLDDIWELPSNIQNNNPDNNIVTVVDLNQFSKWTLITDETPLSNKLNIVKLNNQLKLMGGSEDWKLMWKPSLNLNETTILFSNGEMSYQPIKSGYYRLCEVDGKNCSAFVFHKAEISWIELKRLCAEEENKCRYFDLSGKAIHSLEINKPCLVVLDDGFSESIFKVLPHNQH